MGCGVLVAVVSVPAGCVFAAGWCIGWLVSSLLGGGAVVSPAGRCLLCSWLAVLLALLFVSPAGRCLLYSWLLGGFVYWLLVMERERKELNKQPTQIISPPLIKGGGI